MEKRYDHKRVERKIYSVWEKGGYFTPKVPSGQAAKKKPFVITLPPPNVTGGLHAGHAMYVVEDIMVRYHRMKGEPTLWLPGFDHASIAVESLVSKELAKEGKTKKAVGREEFLRRAKKFAEDSRKYIRNQLKLLGFSLDWSRDAYTMDKIRSRAVEKAFNRLYKKGLIYQGERLINWCPKCETAISDLENVHEEEKGKLYFIKYGPMTIATTRPETMFADVAVAINPKNKKYRHLLGKNVPLPLTERKIPVIEDKAVDPKFGTGALKITPAHDLLDFEIGERHGLEKLVVIDQAGKLTKLAGKYEGLKVKEARKKVVEDLKRKGLIEKIKDYEYAVGHCQRCGAATEPLISKQWFVKIKPLAKRAIEAVKKGKIKIVPKRFEKIYFQWFGNIRDWCISRQLWWGHQLPVWFKHAKFKIKNSKLKIHVGQKPLGSDWIQSQDVLDTWFSSGLWPISVFGWPPRQARGRLNRGKMKKLSDFDYFYPTTVRETAYDILFFWVAREVMMCLEMTGKVPFEVVYLHGLVRDEKGQKFSKTKGIGFDPLELIEKYGADALRMALVIGNPPGKDLKIEENKVVGYRNFANKLWNIGRFILLNFEQAKKKIPFYSPKKNIKLTKEDKEIIKELNQLVQQVTMLINRCRFDLAAEKIYHFVWHRFADQYIEYSKKRLFKKDEVALSVLRHVYLNCLKLLHPFMPFVTEEIWSRLKIISVEDPRRKASGHVPLIISDWPR